MSKHDDGVRLRHMLDAAQKIMKFAEGRNRVDLDTDEVLQLAVIRLLEVLGEAARGVSKSFRENHPEIEWEPITYIFI